MQPDIPNAAVIVIGNEILSGRTQDQNIHYLANQLKIVGIRLDEVRVVRDLQEEIVAAINTLRKTKKYVFTTGGIGPTHDDITAQSVAAAFEVPIVRNAKIAALLEAHYKKPVRENAFLKMADFPKGAQLIDNALTTAPGFRMGNVFVFAGIPAIMQSMFDSAVKHLVRGPMLFSDEFTVLVSESTIAAFLSEIQQTYPDVEIGSYPFRKDDRYAVSVVIKSYNQSLLKEVKDKLLLEFQAHHTVINASL